MQNQARIDYQISYGLVRKCARAKVPLEEIEAVTALYGAQPERAAYRSMLDARQPFTGTLRPQVEVRLVSQRRRRGLGRIFAGLARYALHTGTPVYSPYPACAAPESIDPVKASHQDRWQCAALPWTVESLANTTWREVASGEFFRVDRVDKDFQERPILLGPLSAYGSRRHLGHWYTRQGEQRFVVEDYVRVDHLTKPFQLAWYDWRIRHWTRRQEQTRADILALRPGVYRVVSSRDYLGELFRKQQAELEKALAEKAAFQAGTGPVAALLPVSVALAAPVVAEQLSLL